MTCNSLFASRWKVPGGWVPAVVFGLGILLLLPSIWSESSVTGMDEYWLSLRTPMEMSERGSWLTPWVNGEPRLQKPPLVYWAILFNYKLFGVNLVSARIWGVLCGAGLAVCATLFSRELFRRDGLLAGLLTLATMGVAVEGRRAMLDLPCALFSTLAVLFLLKWVRRQSGGNSEAGEGLQVGRPLPPHPGPLPRGEGTPLAAPRASRTPGNRGVVARFEAGHISQMLMAAFWLGLSFLSKGPVGFLFFGAGVLALVFAFPPKRVLLRNWWQVLLGLAVLAAICLPWPLAMHQLWAERLSRIMGEELAARQFGHWTPGSPLSAWSGALGLVLPWTPLMLAAVYSQARSKSSASFHEKRFLIGWFVLAALPFFFMRSFERYMLALVPAQIVLAAEWWEENQTRSRDVIVRVCVWLLAIVAMAICLFSWWFKLATFQALVLLLCTALALWLAYRSAHPHWIALSAVLLFTIALGAVYPRLGINALPESLPAELSSYRVSMFDPPQPSLLSMRLGRSIQPFKLEKGQDAAADDREIVFVEGARLGEFIRQAQERQFQAEEKGKFRTFYSRRAWIRFARPDARWADWKIALQERSLESLKSEFYFYLLSKAGAKSTTASGQARGL